MRFSIFLVFFVSSFCVVRSQTTDSTTRDIFSILNLLETTSTNQDTQIQQLQSQINQINQQLANAGGSTVAFYAKDQPASTVNQGVQTDFIYFNVDFNEGGGYDSSTGIFTAPLSGFYYFAATAGGYNRGIIGIFIAIDGVRATSLSESASAGKVHFVSAHLTCYLNKNQQVSVKTFYAGFYFSGDASFQGFLISGRKAPKRVSEL